MLLRQVLAIVPFLAILAAAAWYTDDLEQDNKEHLFLSDAGRQSYDTFRSETDDRKMVVLRLTTQYPLDEDLFSKLHGELELLTERHDRNVFQFITLADIYKTPLNPLESFSQTQQLLTSRPELLLKLQGERSLGFIVFVDWQGTRQQIARLVEDVRGLEQKPSISKVDIGGLPYTNYLLNGYAKQIKLELFPAMFGLCLLLTLLLTFSLWKSLVLVFPSLFAIATSMAVIKWLFGDLNMITSIVPLMLFVINLSVAYHLYCTLTQEGSFRAVLRKKWVPLALMIVTTTIGFGSLIVSEIPVIRQFAKLNLLLIVATCAATISWIYATRRLLLTPAADRGLLRRLSVRPFSRGLGYRAIVLLFVVLVLGAWFAVQRLTILTDATEYFPKHERIKESLAAIEEDLLGNPIYDILVDNVDSTALSATDHLAMHDLEQELRKQFADYTLVSANTLAMEVSYLMTGSRRMPATANQLAALYQHLPDAYGAGFTHQGPYRIALMGSGIGQERFERELADLQETLRRFPHLTARVGGLNHDMMSAQSSLIRVLAYSFLLSILIICLLVFAYFRRFRVLWVFLLINVGPVLGGVCLLYLLGFSLNIATVMTFSIALGMVVDSTLHITYDLQAGTDPREYFRITLVPVITSGLLLVSSFLIFGLSPFLPIHQVGITLALTLLIGLFFDLYVLPTLILKRPHYF